MFIMGRGFFPFGAWEGPFSGASSLLVLRRVFLKRLMTWMFLVFASALEVCFSRWCFFNYPGSWKVSLNAGGPNDAKFGESGDHLECQLQVMFGNPWDTCLREDSSQKCSIKVQMFQIIPETGVSVIRLILKTPYHCAWKTLDLVLAWNHLRYYILKSHPIICSGQGSVISHTHVVLAFSIVSTSSTTKKPFTLW